MRAWGAFGALLLCVAIAVPSTAVGAPRVSREQAEFTVVVEGSGTATRQVDGDGTNGACHVSAHTSSSETYEYGRGKGLTFVFTRFRGIPHSPVFLKRKGQRSFRPTFNVRGSYEDTAQGQATRSGESVCEPLTEMVGDESECNRKIARAIDMALSFEGRKLKLELADPDLTRLPGAGCGSDAIETLSGWPMLGWGGFPEFDPTGLPPSLIFGHKHGFVVHFRSEDEKRTESPLPVFIGSALDKGEHAAAVRFIRVGP